MNAESEPGRTRKPSVLIVDDEPGIIEILQVSLEWEGYTVLSASNGRQALEMTRTHRPDLMILDVMMPEMDGWEVLAAVESDPDLAGLPVVMLTVKSLPGDVIHGLELGAIEYLTKPFDPLAVVRTVNLLLTRLDRRGWEAHRRQAVEYRRRMMKSLAELF